MRIQQVVILFNNLAVLRRCGSLHTLHATSSGHGGKFQPSGYQSVLDRINTRPDRFISRHQMQPVTPINALDPSAYRPTCCHRISRFRCAAYPLAAVLDRNACALPGWPAPGGARNRRKLHPRPRFQANHTAAVGWGVQPKSNP